MKHHRAEFFKMLNIKLDAVIAASDQFENSRGKLLANLVVVKDLASLKQDVKDVFELRSTASAKHSDLTAYMVANNHCCSDHERAQMGEALSLGYKHIKAWAEKLS